MGSGMGQHAQHGQMSPREYSSSSAPQIKLDQAPSNPPQLQSYQSGSAVPNVLQPGGLAGRPAASSSNTAPTLPSMQQPEYSNTPSKPPSLSLSHTYSRSSPASSPYEAGGSGYLPYTPTTPNAGSSSQFMSPTDHKYAPGSQRNISNTPLGLADIRPRADSSLSDGIPGSLQYELANGQPGTSNYLAPWALYAFDWCKWPAHGNGAGKVALGSYLEDGHNFVRIPTFLPPPFYACIILYFRTATLTKALVDPNSRHADGAHSVRSLYAWLLEIQHGIHKDSRGYAFIPGDSPALGAAILSEAVDRSTCNIG